jgi:hypothetical protein
MKMFIMVSKTDQGFKVFSSLFLSWAPGSAGPFHAEPQKISFPTPTEIPRQTCGPGPQSFGQNHFGQRPCKGKSTLSDGIYIEWIYLRRQSFLLQNRTTFLFQNKVDTKPRARNFFDVTSFRRKQISQNFIEGTDGRTDGRNIRRTESVIQALLRA